jgi:hypothetical protein
VKIADYRRGFVLDLLQARHFRHEPLGVVFDKHPDAFRREPDGRRGVRRGAHSSTPASSTLSAAPLAEQITADLAEQVPWTRSPVFVATINA